jgi:integrase
MPSTILTDVAINALQPAPEGKRYIITDEKVPGLGVRVTDRGEKSFVVGARFPDSPQHFTRRRIALVGQITLAVARQIARDWNAKIARGEDPKPAPEGKPDTFAAVAAEFIERHLKDKRKGPVVEREINRELLPVWGNRPIQSITQRDVVALLEAVADRGRGSNAYARNIWTHISTLFAWAQSRGILETSPCDRIKPKAVLGEKKIRDRILSDEELRALWRADVAYPMSQLTKWFMLTGCRLSEGLGATWGEFDESLWTIPAARFKSGQNHLVPLTDDMRALLATLPRWVAGDFLFSMDGTKPFGGISKAKARLDRASGVEGWTFHDIRRRLSGLRVPEPVSEMIIGHSKRGLERIYNQHRYIDEMREALAAWNMRLMEIVG